MWVGQGHISADKTAISQLHRSSFQLRHLIGPQAFNECLSAIIDEHGRIMNLNDLRGRTYLI